MKSIIKAARIQMAEDLIAASADSTRILGLGDLFQYLDTTLEYGSIAESIVADWKANVIIAAAEICFETMQLIFRQPNMGDSDEMLPNFCVTTPTLRDGYERSLHPQQRYTDTSMVEAGWRNIVHKGAPIVGDSYVAAGDLYALNLNFLELRSHKDYQFTTPVWVAKTQLGQPDTITADTRWRGNLYCKNRKMHVLHKNLTEPV
jgi:hypothetical protein